MQANGEVDDAMKTEWDGARSSTGTWVKSETEAETLVLCIVVSHNNKIVACKATDNPESNQL
jgi:hypothetical protein